MVWHGITHRPQGDVHDAIVAIILRLAPTIIVSAGTSVVVTELGRYAAMLSDILREKVDKWIAKSREEDREKARAKGLAEGLAEGRAIGLDEGLAEGRAEGQAIGQAERQRLWLEWNQSRIDHESRGEPFDEPPPSLNGENGYRENGAEV